MSMINTAELSARLGVVPLVDLADCAHVSHRAVGSPHFDARGEPRGFDPLISLIYGDLIDERLPHATLIIVPSDPRPLLSIDPLLQSVISVANPRLHTSLRADLEGKIERGSLKQINPGELIKQTDMLALAQLETHGIKEIQRGFQEIAQRIRATPSGATIRMSLPELESVALAESALESLLDIVTPALLSGWPQKQPRRLILITESEERAYAHAVTLVKRAVRKSFVDQVTQSHLSPRVSYGFSALPQSPNRLISDERISSMCHALDQFIRALLDQDRSSATRAARDLLLGDQKLPRDDEANDEQDPGGEELCRRVYVSLSTLIDRPESVAYVLSRELARAVSRGALLEATPIAEALCAVQLSEESHSFGQSVLDCAERYQRAEFEALLSREEYTSARAVYEASSDETRSTPEAEIALRELSDTLSLLFEQLLMTPWRFTPRGAPLRTLERSLAHLASLSRESDSPSLRCDELARALEEWVQELAERGPFKVEGPIAQRRWRAELSEVVARLDQVMRRDLSGPLSDALRPHYELQVAMILLSRSGKVIKPEVTLDVWRRLCVTLRVAPAPSFDRHIALGYLTLLTLSRGRRALYNAQLLLTLWSQMIERELSEGVYGIQTLSVPLDLSSEVIQAPLTTRAASHAHLQLKLWREHALALTELASGLERDELSPETALSRYESALLPLESLEQTPLRSPYQERLGMPWISLFVSQQRAPLKASLSAFMGEAVFEAGSLLWRFIKRWRFFYRLRGGTLQERLEETLGEVERMIEESAERAD